MKKTLEKKQVVKEIPKKKSSYQEKLKKELEHQEALESLSKKEAIIKIIYSGNEKAFELDFSENLQKKEESILDQDTCNLSINHFRHEVRKDTPQELLNQHIKLFTQAEYNAILELLYSHFTVEVEIYNGKLTTMSSTKYCSNPNGILRLNIRTTKDSSNE